MTTPENERDPYAILKDAVAQHLTLIGCIPTDMNGDEALSCVYESASDLDFALGLAKGAHANADMGGTRLDLSLEETRYLRALLDYAAQSEDQWTLDEEVADMLTTVSPRAIRKRLNAGVVRRCEARTTTTEEAFRPAPAEACADSDDEEVVT